MRKVKVKEVANLDPNEIIPSIQGTLVKAWDFKTGEGEDGAWSFQTASLKDSTGEIKLVLKNQDNVKGMLNREVLITSHSGPKGLSGIYADDNEWPKDSGKFTRQIKVTATAKIALIDTPSKAAEGSRARPDNETVSGQPSDSVKAFKARAMKSLNASWITIHAVNVLRDQLRIDGIEMTDENFGGVCGKVDRDCSSLIDSLPSKPLWSAEKQLAEKPAEDEEVPW